MEIKSKFHYIIIQSILASLVLSVALPACAATSRHSDESSLRAAVVLGILRFTDWYPALPDNHELKICHLGNPKTIKKLTLASGKVKVKGRVTRVIALDLNKAVPNDFCPVLIIGSDLPSEHYSILASLKRALTICDQCNQQDSTAINLLKNNNKIGFEINLTHTKARNILLSSSLLELASQINE